jgi:hypothetical protein
VTRPDNALRSPLAQLCQRTNTLRGFQPPGAGAVLDLPEALEPLVEYFRVMSGERQNWDEYRGAIIEQGKVPLRITPTRWGPVATAASLPAWPTTDLGQLPVDGVGALPGQ